MFTYLFHKHVIVSIPNEISHNHNTLANRSKRTFFFNIPICTSNILRFYAHLPKNILRFLKKAVPLYVRMFLSRHSDVYVLWSAVARRLPNKYLLSIE